MDEVDAALVDIQALRRLGKMSKVSKSEDDGVKVHVTYFGGMYVDPGELLRSKAAQKTIAEMSRILREERAERQGETGAGPSLPQATRGQ